MKYIWSLVLLCMLTACATSDQKLPNDQNLGEGNKDMTMALFDSVATTQAAAKLKDGQDTRGGTYTQAQTTTVIEQVPFDVKVAVIDDEGNAVLDASGNPAFETVTKFKTIKRVIPLVDSKGNVVYMKATGFRNFVINYGEISPTMTSSGESTGSNTSGQQPVSTPTNSPETNPNFDLTGQ